MTASRPQLLFVDGTFEELAQEMADYLRIGDDLRPLLAKSKKEEALQKLVAASGALSAVAEKEFTSASNLMIYLVLQSGDSKRFLQALCQNFSKPVASSPVNGVGLSLNALTTVFNLLEPTNPIRARVFLEILKFFKQHGMFETLKPYLEHLPAWLESWDTDEELQRKLYEEVAGVADEAGEDEECYQYILKALRTFDSDEINSDDAQRLSLRALRMALLSNTHFLFQDLRAVPSVQTLSDSHPAYSELLDIFAEQDLEDYNNFNEEHEGFLEKEKLDRQRLDRKMRLLSFASLAATTPSREVPYKSIASSLQIPAEDVEMWAIDVIRAGLVEGKLSQQKQMFLVHKVTYRVFTEKQYQELSSRVDQWRATLQNVIGVLRQEQAEARVQKERKVLEIERSLANPGGEGGGQHQRGDRRRGGGGGGGGGQQQQRERNDDED